MGPGTPVSFSFHSKCPNQRSAIWALRAVLGGLPLRRGDPNRYSKISPESRIQRSHQRLPEGLRGERCLDLNSPQEPGRGLSTGRGRQSLLSSSPSWSSSPSRRPGATKLRSHLSGDIPGSTPLPEHCPCTGFPSLPGHPSPLP